MRSSNDNGTRLPDDPQSPARAPAWRQLELDVHPKGHLFEAIEYMLNQRRLAESTLVQQHDHRRWLLEYFGDCDVNAITYERVMEYVRSEGPDGRGLMFDTVKKRLMTLRTALDDSYRRKLLAEKPDWWPRLPKDGTANEKFWDYPTYRQARLAFEPEQRIGVDVMFHCGVHVSDLRRFRRDMVRPGQWLRMNTKSKAKPEWMPLPSEMEEIFEAWFLERGIGERDLVAPEFWVSPIKPMRRVCHRAGVQRCTPNTLRSSCVSRLLELGCDIEFVAKYVGHRSDPKTSAVLRRHYARFTPSMLDQQAALLRR